MQGMGRTNVIKEIANRSLLFAVIIWCATSFAFSQSPDNTTTATITGRVTVNGKGLGGVAVGAGRSPSSSRPLIPASLRAKTDADGNYAIHGLPSGTYYLSFSAPGFIAVTGGTPTGDFKPISVVAGEVVRNMDFRLVRGGVVSGRVSTKTGEPVVEQQINLVQVDQPPGPPFPTLSNNLDSRTDDRGMYRIFGIPAGRYKVAAGPAIAAYGSFMGHRAYKRVFYPDVVDESKAKIVEVSEGSENTGIDITGIVYQPTFSIKGRIVDNESGLPVPSIMVGLEILSGDKRIGGLNGQSFSDPDGRFVIENIPAGRYLVSAPSQASRADLPASDFFGASPPFDIVDKDTSGIVVQAKRGASVSGFVALENMKDTAAWNRLVALRLTIMSFPAPSGTISARQALVAGDGSFTVSGLKPGTLNFQWNLGESSYDATGFRWRRLEHNGVEKTDKLKVEAGDLITNVRLVFTTGSGGISGVVKCEPGPCPSTMRGTARLLQTNSAVALTILDARGHFLFENLQDGEYTLTVTTEALGFRGGAAVPQQVVVADGANQKVSVTINLNASSN